MAAMAERRRIRLMTSYIVAMAAIAAGLSLGWPGLYVPGVLLWIDLQAAATIRLVAREMKGNERHVSLR